MPLNEIQVVEYSVKQGCYHIQPLDQMIIANLETVDQNKECDYVPLGFFKSYEAAAHFVDFHRKHKNLSKYTINQNGELNY